MKYMIFTFVIFLLNAIIAFLLTIQAHNFLTNGGWTLGLLTLSIAVINAYCAIDGIEVLSKKFQEYKNG